MYYIYLSICYTSSIYNLMWSVHEFIVSSSFVPYRREADYAPQEQTVSVFINTKLIWECMQLHFSRLQSHGIYVALSRIQRRRKVWWDKQLKLDAIGGTDEFLSSPVDHAMNVFRSRSLQTRREADDDVVTTTSQHICATWWPIILTFCMF